MALQAHNVVRFLQPAPQLRVKVRACSHPDMVHAPAGPIVDRFGDSRALQPTMQRKVRQEMIPARLEAGEANARHHRQTRLLRDDLHVAKGAEHSDVLSREGQHGGL